MRHKIKVRAEQAMPVRVWPEKERSQVLDERFAPMGQNRIGTQAERKTPPKEKHKSKNPPPRLRPRAKRSACVRI